MDVSNSKAISAKLEDLNVVLTNFSNSITATAPFAGTITTTGAQPWSGSVTFPTVGDSFPNTDGGQKHNLIGRCFPSKGDFWNGDAINKDGPFINKDHELFEILRKQTDVAQLDAKLVELRALVAAEEEKLAVAIAAREAIIKSIDDLKVEVKKMQRQFETLVDAELDVEVREA
jgi:hypothetical protein